MELKPGTKTTEFWVALTPVLGGLVESLKGDAVTGRYLITCGTVLAALYMISRTFLKLKAEKAKPNS